MKLLLCLKCNDVRKIASGTGAQTFCDCGRVWARYVDEINAEWNGHGFLIGLSNPSLVQALRDQRDMGDLPDGMGRRFEAFIIPSAAPTVAIRALAGEGQEGGGKT